MAEVDLKTAAGWISGWPPPKPGEEEPQQALPLHENIRGRGYYH